MLNRLILLIYHASSCLKRTGITFIADSVTAARRLLCVRSNFSKSVMVSIAVSKMGMTELIFVDPGTKVNAQYYCDVLFSQQMLPAIKHVANSTHRRQRSLLCQSVVCQCHCQCQSKFFNVARIAELLRSLRILGKIDKKECFRR